MNCKLVCFLQSSDATVEGNRQLNLNEISVHFLCFVNTLKPPMLTVEGKDLLKIE